MIVVATSVCELFGGGDSIGVGDGDEVGVDSGGKIEESEITETVPALQSLMNISPLAES